jgi:phosphatidate cytidylyltransferase
MHLKRWISGLIMAPSLILFILFAPPWLFLLLIFFLTFVGLYEFYGMTLPGIPQREKIAWMLLSLAIPLSFYSSNAQWGIAGLTLVFLLIFIVTLSQSDEIPARFEKVSRHLLGFIYLPLLLAHFVLFRKLEAGTTWILFTLVAVYFGDSLAFYVGRAWGRRKLAPQISPGKTVEGGLGAVGGSLLGALLFKLLFFNQLPFGHALVLGMGVGAIGQIGDLFESLIKRSARVKDSGTLIPGHGGLLDRIDSILFACPFVYYYSWLL